jgi:hypothetical protein
MADPVHTFFANHFYQLVYNTGTFEYTVGADLGPHAVGDDEGDLDLTNGTAGDGTEAINEALTFDGVPGTGATAGSYVGQMIAGAPIIMQASLYYLATDVSGLTGSTGTADAGVYVYPVCFVSGTRMATPAGECPVESLKIGDLVATASGAQKAVKWIGRMSVPLTRFNRETAAPICIKQGALGKHMPQRDLYVSNDHAIAIDGLLVIAGLLVNGSSIVRCDDYSAAVVEYFHVELDEHELLLAEGVAAESFYNVGNARAKFDNAAEFAVLYPGHLPGLPMALGRVTAKRQMPGKLSARWAVLAA